ncbi:acetyl-CoA decarbonylase/synthase alpha subunit [Archaeoglobus sulfaticallidus PM70-1]|uniref:Acetyl-CoA decarbonylase/synthase complex subunit alpha n=1 Tax=Archaeoglobus sulfaticallidus PM70-1 TaxID=387631 RepID=N0BG73_9EURY|nr:CO dehydrogenase/acetyl-CoA synthase complex subunit alpha [Archaeoglobus sulfaticallidus]AGK61993.1 acetyl-CoA decarbonylase/synthase alpha subunit [Archaeoglobus sulfaticallidus PM70-1]
MAFELKEGIFVLDELKNVSIKIGKVVEEEEEKEWAPMGPTPMPGIATLRDWDFLLLKRYKPFYAPYCDMCCLCTMGKCDLTGNKRGACGIDLAAQTGRIVTIACAMGTACHTGHARHMLHDIEHMLGKKLDEIPVDLGPEIAEVAPLTELITGIKPKTLADLERALRYAEEQIVQVMDSVHTGQEGSYLDYESKALHLGMIDALGKEIADIAQICAFGFPKGESNQPYIEVGMGVLDRSKAVVLVIGHHAPPAIDIADYIDENNLGDEVDLGGICCTAHDVTRYYQKAKIVGSLGRQLKAIRAGIADVIVIDEQCIRADILYHTKKLGIPVICTNEKAMHALPDMTKADPKDIIKYLLDGNPGVVILDPLKVGEVAVEVARARRKMRGDGISPVLSDEEFANYVKSCTQCGNCTIACPQGIRIGDAMEAAENGDKSKLEHEWDICIACGRCEQVCPKNIPIIDVLNYAAWDRLINEKGKVRRSRGPVRDSEIRNVGAPIVLGTIPGIIAIVGCSNYPNGTKDAYTIMDEFASRNYIVVTTGCMAMDAGLYKDEDGLTVYEKYNDDFDGGCVANLGSCVANAHIHGAAIKVARIFAKRNIRANFEEIADYILNRLGACGVAWGAYSQKAASIATGVNRLGIPVVVGPHGSKYRRAFLGRPYNDEDWMVYDVRTGKQVRIEPAPQDLLVAAETVEEAIPLIAKLCFRPNDTDRGRSIKLTHYIDLSMKYLGRMPDDWHLYVRTESDLPLAKREELLKILEEEHGWKIDWDKKKIVEGPVRPYYAGFNPTIVERLFKEGFMTL